MTAIEIARLVCAMPISVVDRVQLGHGSGGRMSATLLSERFLSHLSNDALAQLGDGSVVSVAGTEIVISTDTFVVSPLEFPGGDIGELAVNGTVNDLAMMGAQPLALSLAYVIEEGLPIEDLRKVTESVARAADRAGVRIVTGDTKVVPRGKGGGLFMTTAGIGLRAFPHELSPNRIREGDSVIVSAPIGAHGLTVLAARESLPVADSLRSDMACLYPAVSLLFPLAEGLRFMRDATRGGVSSVLNEIAHGQSWGIEVEEEAFPVTEEVRTVADLLGLNVLEIANEGVFVAVVSKEREVSALEALHVHPLGTAARCVGHVSKSRPGAVVMTTRVGGTRLVDFPRGILMPRIC